MPSLKNEAGAPSSVRSSSDFTISSDATIHAPSIGVSSYATLAVTIPVTNEGGATCTLYYVVLPSGRPVPSTSNIQSATDFSGNVLVSSGGTVDVVVRGLPLGAHRFHAFFELEAGMTSLVSNSDPFAIPTVALTAPRFGAVELMADSATLVVQSTNDSVLRLYWMVCPAEADAPTKDAIETATTRSGSAVVGAEGSQRISVRDLAPDTAYRLHAFFKAEADGSSSAVSSGESFTTPAS